MAMRQVWLGSVGPFLYDDADEWAIRTDGNIFADNVVGANFEGTGVTLGVVDPSVTPGVTAPVGALFGRNNSGSGELWLKTGSANTAWTRINVP